MSEIPESIMIKTFFTITNSGEYKQVYAESLEKLKEKYPDAIIYTTDTVNYLLKVKYDNTKIKS
jgi:hypothetical protein